jgi:coenzyme F420-dependent glucose-6-phosphate dehydrogenase
MNKGDFYLGVGIWEAINEYPTTGQWPSYYKRQNMMRETIELMRVFWSREEVTFNCEYYRTRKTKLYTNP